MNVETDLLKSVPNYEKIKSNCEDKKIKPWHIKWQQKTSKISSMMLQNWLSGSVYRLD